MVQPHRSEGLKMFPFLNSPENCSIAAMKVKGERLHWGTRASTSKTTPLHTYHRSATSQRQAVTSHHPLPCGAPSSWHRCHLSSACHPRPQRHPPRSTEGSSDKQEQRRSLWKYRNNKTRKQENYYFGEFFFVSATFFFFFLQKMLNFDASSLKNMYLKVFFNKNKNKDLFFA